MLAIKHTQKRVLAIKGNDLIIGIAESVEVLEGYICNLTGNLIVKEYSVSQAEIMQFKGVVFNA